MYADKAMQEAVNVGQNFGWKTVQGSGLKMEHVHGGQLTGLIEYCLDESCRCPAVAGKHR